MRQSITHVVETYEAQADVLRQHARRLASARDQNGEPGDPSQLAQDLEKLQALESHP